MQVIERFEAYCLSTYTARMTIDLYLTTGRGSRRSLLRPQCVRRRELNAGAGTSCNLKPSFQKERLECTISVEKPRLPSICIDPTARLLGTTIALCHRFETRFPMLRPAELYFPTFCREREHRTGLVTERTRLSLTGSDRSVLSLLLIANLKDTELARKP